MHQEVAAGYPVSELLRMPQHLGATSPGSPEREDQDRLVSGFPALSTRWFVGSNLHRPGPQASGLLPPEEREDAGSESCAERVRAPLPDAPDP